MYEVLGKLTDKARKRETGSWFKSIHGILNHLIICELNWLKRFPALSPESPVLSDPRLDPPTLSWEHDLHDDFVDLGATRVAVDERTRAWFDEFPASRYAEAFNYKDST